MEGTYFHCLNPPQGFVRTVVHRQRFLNVETIAVQDDNVGVMPKAIAWLVNHTVANCFDVMAEQKCV